MAQVGVVSAGHLAPMVVVLAGVIVGGSAFAFLKRPERSVRLCCWGIGLCVFAAALSCLSAP